MIKTIKELQRLLTAMKVAQEEGNQDDMTPVIEEQLRAFDVVIDAIENFEDKDIDILMEDDMKMYTIEMNEIMAEQVMVSISADTEGDDPVVCDKFAEVVPVIPSDCDNVTVSLTADEMYEVFKTYIDITGGRN